MTEYFEPLEGRIWLFKLLLTKDAYFIVICPGSEERVAEVQQEVPFMHHPFIGGKQAMQIGRELKLCISDEELWPAIVAIAPHRFNASIIKLGRSFGDMAHQTLIKYLFDKRIPVERKGVAFMEEARRTIEKLRLKATKCHQGRLVTTLSLRPCSPPAVPAQSQLAQTQKWTSLPPEILQNILSFIPETRYIAKAARTSRQFYMAYCNVLMKRLREQSTQVRHALPSDTEQLKVVGGGYQDADRWWYSPNGIGLRDLERRVDGLERLLRETPGDIRPFFRRTLGWTFEIPPPQEQGLSRFQ
ncbi:hypothetical protein BX666DRAFT_1875215 [Dichotomocladium elegans]|nr:hypothetical protein BX666DRAFT_1875215 [Dichotomocladium elegans]